MADPSPWRELAEHFAKIRLEDQDQLVASCTTLASAWSANGERWYLGGINRPRVHTLFRWGAERGAVLLGEPPGPATLEYWLDRLRLYSPHYQPSDKEKYEIGFIRRVCLASQEYCFKLDTEYIAERRSDELQQAVLAALVASPDRATSPSHGSRRNSTPAETIAQQIERLRVECDWKLEVLAEMADISVRTAQRHVSGVTKPSARLLARYERIFSKQLKIKVVIEKLS